MNLTIGTLVSGGVAPTQARQIIDTLRDVCKRFDISTAPRAGGFVGQCWVESIGFTDFEENCYWSSPERIAKFFPSRVTSIEQASRLARNPRALANCVYAGKNGNGNPLSEDGWNYRGRGAIQLTGRSNYADAATALARPYLEQPDLVGALPDALLTAGWYWHTHKLNLLADSAQWDAITRAINGPALDQSALRRQRSVECMQAFS